jgi:hypothetical protein
MRDCRIETLQPAQLATGEQKDNIAIYASQELLSETISSNDGVLGIPADSLILNILYSLKTEWEIAPGFENSNFSVFLLDSTDSLPNLSDYDVTVRLERMQIRNTYYAEQFGYMEWEAYLHVYCLARWIVSGKNGLFDEYSDRDLMVWPSGICLSQSEAVLKLPNIYDAWWDAGIMMAKNYIGRITPQWETGIRNIFMINKFSDLSAQAYSAMQNNGYGRAFNIWEEMLLACRKKGQKKMKSRITYNMAVAREFEDRLDEALSLIKKSVNENSGTANNYYLRLLTQRKNQSTQLDQQINR